MPWYLPDQYPVFWEEIRRYCYGRRHSGLLLGLLPVVLAFAVVLILHALHWRSLGTLLHGAQSVLVFLLPSLAAAGMIRRDANAGEQLYLTPIPTRALVSQQYLAVFMVLFYLPFLFGVLLLPLEIHQVDRLLASFIVQLMRLASFTAIAVCTRYRCHSHARAFASYSMLVIYAALITLFTTALFAALSGMTMETAPLVVVLLGNALGLAVFFVICLRDSCRSLAQVRDAVKAPEQTYVM
jgi:hypothetical protein